ncbi:hypothetical protein Syun_005743 [Stephania yunnanensis]|uniref:Integrase catalytic domain-containing protein n=1 Tax=Stephania yunnanensis TaxID=152371 RepID=A0AAP0KVD6_9MAGN
MGIKVGRLFELTSLHIPVVTQISRSSSTPSIYRWHLRLGHTSTKKLRTLVSGGLLGISKFESFNCVHCQLAKQPASSFSLNESINNTPFGLVHSDVWGPAPTSTVNGYRYFVLFIDDYSRFTWIYFLKHRSEISQTYIEFANMIKTQFARSIKIFRTDNALELIP